MSISNVPACCRDCVWFCVESGDFGSIIGYACDLGIFLPTKKQTCKKKKPYRQPALETDK